MTPLLAIAISLALALLGIAIFSLHKIRQIHLAAFRLLDDSSATRRETESLYAQMQAAAALQSLLGLSLPLPAMRGWAGSPDFLLHLAQSLLVQRPQAVLECSSGVSTLISARCVQISGRGHVWSLEHEASFAQKTRELLAQHGLSEWATVLVAPLVSRAGASPWYDETVLPGQMPPVETLVIDGPPEATAPLARAPAFERLRSRLAPAARIFVDDADRPAETEMVRQWLTVEPALKVDRLPAEKGLAVVTLPA